MFSFMRKGPIVFQNGCMFPRTVYESSGSASSPALAIVSLFSFSHSGDVKLYLIVI